MKIADLLSLLGIVISTAAAIISVAILYQMKQDTDLARRDSELKIRPIIFIKDVIANMKGDEVDSLTLIVTNAGLGPALNVRSRVGEDIRMPGSGAVVRTDVFQESSIIQVLPNAASAVSGSSNVSINMTDRSSMTLAGGVTSASGMTNNLVTYKNRPKRSDTIEQVG